MSAALEPQAVQRAVAALWRGQGRPVEFEETITFGGTTRVYSSVRAPLRDDMGNLSGVVGVSTDIERKLLMEALKQADRSKDEFLAMLAHELRNPLAPIANATEIMALKTLEDDELLWCREVIERQVKHLTRLVDDLLDVSRISHGKVNLQREPIAVAEVVTRAIETSNPVIRARDQELLVEMPGEELMVYGDATRLAQVIGNLLNNAAKYSENGGRIWLIVEGLRRKKDEAPAEVLIRVKDEGTGISPELLPQLFELFAQGPHAMERAEGGLGVGLALVRRLVVMHGGSVSASSEGPRKGSEFAVRLPLCTEVPQVRAEVPEEPAPSPQGRRILIVDDNVDSATSLRLLLQRQGHEVRQAHDGLAGLAAAEEFRPDVLLLDIGLPEMNGYELARRIRAQPWGKDATLIALTGWSQDDVRGRTLEAGFDIHLIKPVDAAELMRLMKTLPLRRRQRGDLEPTSPRPRSGSPNTR